MKIRTQFILSASILGVILVGSLLLVVLINQRVQETHEQELLATQIEREAYELGYLANDYLLYRDSQLAGRWESKFASFSNDVSNLKASTRQEQGFVNNIKTNQQRLRNVFAEVRAGIESPPPTQSAAEDVAPLQVTWSLVQVQNQGMIFDASRLVRVLRERQDQLQQVTSWLNFGLVGLFGAFLFITYGLIFRRTLTSIAGLQAGTRVIGTGNLAYTLAENRHDEIGELAQAFNQMTANLRATMASKAELEREVEERKRAEERAQHLASFPQLNPNPVIEVDASSNITFANPAADQLLARLGAEPGNVRALLPNSLEGILKDWDQETTAVHYRETVVKDCVLGETITLIPQFKAARLYAFDITERKRSEEALRDSEEQFRVLTQNLVSAVALVNERGEFSIVNQSFLRMFDLDEKATILNVNSRDWSRWQVFAEDGSLLDVDEHPVRKAILTRTAVKDKLIAVQSAARTDPLWLLVSAEPILDAHGNLHRLICTYHDFTAHKRVEDDLRKSEQRLRALVTASSNVIYRMSPDWSEMRELDGRGFIADMDSPSIAWEGEYIPPDEQRRVDAAIQEAIRTKSMFELEHQVRRVDGSLGWTLSRAVPLLNEKGEIVEWFGAASDVTARKQAEEALQKNEARLRAVFGSLSEGVVFLNTRGEVEQVNEAIESAHGHMLQELVDPDLDPRGRIVRPDGTLFPVDEQPAIVALRTGQSVMNVEMGVPTRDGKLRWRLVSAQPARDDEGHLIGAVASFFDISDRKRAEEALRQRTEELQAIMEAVPTAVFITRDPDARTITGNRAAREIVELPPSANISKSAPEADRLTGWLEMRNGVPIAPDDLPMQQAGRGKEVRDYEMDLIFRDGSMKSVVGHATPLRDKDGNPQGAIAVLIDVTERKRAEESLREAMTRIEKLNEELEQRAQDLEMTSEELRVTNEELQGANEKLRIANLNFEAALAQEQSTRLALQATNKELEAFTYTVAHDLRAPLNLIEQFSEMLLQDYCVSLAEPGPRLLHLIHENAASVNGLAEDLLTLSRLTQQSPVKRSVNMQDLVQHILADLKAQAGRPVEWVVGDLPEAVADPVLLKQVWTNLISNALKFTRPRAVAHIEIGSYQEPSQTIYFVKDDGTGFDMRQATRLFRAFHRLHHHEEYEGHGLGLAIVERIIRRHGGRVWANAQADGGATFYFSLEATEAA